jgi:hypothetical protein
VVLRSFGMLLNSTKKTVFVPEMSQIPWQIRPNSLLKPISNNGPRSGCFIRSLYCISLPVINNGIHYWCRCPMVFTKCNCTITATDVQKVPGKVSWRQFLRPCFHPRRCCMPCCGLSTLGGCCKFQMPG